jgi:cold shock CspA family protein
MSGDAQSVVFVHILAVEETGLSSLNEGAKVSYEEESGETRPRKI